MTSPHLVGLAFGVGVVLMASAVLPRPGDGTAAVEAGIEPGRAGGVRRRRLPPGWLPVAAWLASTVAAVVVAWAVFRLPVLAGAAGAVVVAPLVLRRAPTETTARDLGETATTVARWIEGVRDHLLTASTLQDALIRASHDVRGPHAVAFQRFAATLTTAGGYGPAAEDLADELRSSLADKALTALWIGGRDGGDIQTALGLLAESAQTEADNARRIEAGLAGIRRLVRIVSILCVGILALALFAFRENFEVYRSAGGQVLLAGGLAAMAGSWWGIWRMSRLEAPERLVTVRPVRGGNRPW